MRRSAGDVKLLACYGGNFDLFAVLCQGGGYHTGETIVGSTFLLVWDVFSLHPVLSVIPHTGQRFSRSEPFAYSSVNSGK